MHNFLKLLKKIYGAVSSETVLFYIPTDRIHIVGLFRADRPR